MNGEIALAEMKIGRAGVISQIDGGGRMVRRLEALGVRPGKTVEKVSSVFDRGPVIISLDGRMIAVGRRQAMRIFVIEN
ncbi:MAG: ferrous iron transport protein A [Firmicutes bacterium]|nr:ferrous iron transport protein A [Bacillota bacterium]